MASETERRSGLERRIHKRASQRRVDPMHEVASEIDGRRLRFWDGEDDYGFYDRRQAEPNDG